MSQEMAKAGKMQNKEFKAKLRKQVIKHNKILVVKNFKAKVPTVQEQENKLNDVVKIKAPANYSRSTSASP